MLVLEGRQLEEHELLLDLGIKDGTTVELAMLIKLNVQVPGRKVVEVEAKSSDAPADVKQDLYICRDRQVFIFPLLQPATRTLTLATPLFFDDTRCWIKYGDGMLVLVRQETSGSRDSS